MSSYCRYCDRNVPTKEIEIHKETYIINGKKQTIAWVGCKNCWELLQKVS